MKMKLTKNERVHLIEIGLIWDEVSPNEKKRYKKAAVESLFERAAVRFDPSCMITQGAREWAVMIG